jgi:membrane protein DedA with SNARE-associated domain
MEQWLISIYASHHYAIYAVIMVVGLFEGPFVSMVCGAILALGYLSFWPLYAVLVLGDLLGDALWYFLGHRFGEKFIQKFGKYFGITERHVERIKNVFQVRKNLILLASKISNGLGFALAVLFSAGMSGVPFMQFMAINALGQLIWSGALIGIGFFFGDLYLSINSIAGKISIVFIFAVFIFAANRYRRYLQNKID